MITDPHFIPLESRWLVAWKCNKGSAEQVKEIRANSAVSAVSQILWDSESVAVKRKSQDHTEFVMKVKGYHLVLVSKI